MGTKKELKTALLEIYAEVVGTTKFTNAAHLREVLLNTGVSDDILNKIHKTASFIRVMRESLNASNSHKLKPVLKKEVLKCAPGTWLRLAWNDSSDNVALLLETPDTGKGDISLKCFYPDTGDINSHAIHTQVVAILDELVVPEIK